MQGEDNFLPAHSRKRRKSFSPARSELRERGARRALPAATFSAETDCRNGLQRFYPLRQRRAESTVLAFRPPTSLSNYQSLVTPNFSLGPRRCRERKFRRRHRDAADDSRIWQPSTRLMYLHQLPGERVSSSERDSRLVRHLLLLIGW